MNQPIPSYRRYLLLALTLLFSVAGAILLIIKSQAAGPNVAASQEQHAPAAASNTHKLEAGPQEEKIRRILEAPVFSEFDAWVEEYFAAPHSGQIQQKGEMLAGRRYELFRELMQAAPKMALEHSVSAATWRSLPASVKSRLEQPVSAYGDFLVIAVDEVDHATGKMTTGRIEREVVIGDSRYKALVYGRREGMTTKLGIPLRGIILDGVMVVDESSVRKLEPSEYATRNVDFAKLGEYGVVAEVGDELAYFSNQQELDRYVREQIEWETKIGPVRPKQNLAPDEMASPYTEGLKTVLFIRVDFPDRPGEPLDASNQPLTQARAQSLMDTQVSPFYVNNSYNKTSLQTTVITPVVRMPQVQSFYFNNFGALFTDARNAGRAAGFETNNFNLDVFAMTYNQGFGYAGIGSVGGKGSALNGYFDLRVTAHELGHNYGLRHSNLWRTTDGTVIGSGSNVEYGDPFDQMGYGGDAKYHFNARYKRLLDWLTDANVQTVTNDGVYRIYAQDSSALGGIRVLKIRKDPTKNYWVEFRQLFTSNPNAMNGAIVRWDYLSANFRQTQLLDMTPNTSTNADDTPLLIGQTFNDNENRIRMTVLGKG